MIRKIQCELKAPKDKRNSFGNYNYRSAEGILEAVKPLLDKYESYITLSDELVYVGDRYYVKATATLCTPDRSYQVTAYAREEETKMGMDASQITGTASSYARKYALNGLLLIDDAKDPDTDEYMMMQKADDKISEAKAKILYSAIMEKHQSPDYICRHHKVDSLSDMTEKQYAEVMTWLQKK